MEELDIQKYVFLFVLKNGRDMLYICIFFVTPNLNSIKKIKMKIFLLLLEAADGNVSASFFCFDREPAQTRHGRSVKSHTFLSK